MNTTAQILAQRYAAAYLNLFGAELTMQDHEQFVQAEQFFKTHKQAAYFLSVPTITDEQKAAIMAQICTELGLPDSSMHLLKLLIKQKRAWLWPETLHAIITLYRERNNILYVQLESASELTEHEQKAFIKFLAERTGRHIIYNYTINTDLIAGIRAQSDTMLWEYSIAQKLRAVRLSLIH